MDVKITINCDNAVFGDYPEIELARILTDLAGKVQTEPFDYIDGMPLRDLNGNTVGRVELTE